MYVGIEIGGTKLQIGLGDGAGHLRCCQRWPIAPHLGAASILEQIRVHLPATLRQFDGSMQEVQGIGIGFGGPVDDRQRVVIKSHQVQGWDHFPLASWMQEQFGRPAALGNDSDLAGLAEAAIGAGRGFDPLFYMNIGSGIGGSLILNGKIHRGVGLGAGEIGHLWIDYDCDGTHFLPHNGRWRILEQRASGWSLAEAFGAARAEIVAAQAEAGDPRAQHVLTLAIRRLAVALSHVVALICPRRMIIGGGFGMVGEKLLFEPLRQALQAIVFPPFREAYDLVPAALGEEVVVHGALLFARQCHAQRKGDRDAATAS